MKRTGIYKIQSLIKPERYYIGSSVNINKRWCYHKEDLGKNKHHAKKLQRHFNKYGKDDLVYSVLEECSTEDLIRREQYWIDLTNPYFNSNITANSRLGIKHSTESKLKMSISVKNKGYSMNSIIAMSNANKNRKYSNETKEKIRKTLTGVKHTKERRLNQSKAKLGKKLSKTHCQNISIKVKESWIKRKNKKLCT